MPIGWAIAYFLGGILVGGAAAALLCLRFKVKPTKELRQAPGDGQSLDSLARGLAHEIRNPLSTMRVNLQLLQEDWGVTETPREERTARKIQVLQQEVQRLEDTLNDFLRYARGHKLTPARANLNTVVSDLAAFFEPQAQQHRIQLRLNLAADLPDCLIDVDLIKQALLNMLINAQQAMPQGGDLILSTSRRDRNQVALDVIDTGTGIDPAIINRIFDAYFSGKRTGTGLGLALTKRIIEEHHGRIEVTSEVGKGSDFRILLPAAEEAGKRK